MGGKEIGDAVACSLVQMECTHFTDGVWDGQKEGALCGQAASALAIQTHTAIRADDPFTL